MLLNRTKRHRLKPLRREEMEHEGCQRQGVEAQQAHLTASDCAISVPGAHWRDEVENVNDRCLAKVLIQTSGLAAISSSRISLVMLLKSDKLPLMRTQSRSSTDWATLGLEHRDALLEPRACEWPLCCRRDMESGSELVFLLF
jgi:hypothetical protein